MAIRGSNTRTSSATQTRRGEGAGEGCNHNYPLAHGSGWDLLVGGARRRLRAAGYADALVISGIRI